jgi:hypothetical protein
MRRRKFPAATAIAPANVASDKTVASEEVGGKVCDTETYVIVAVCRCVPFGGAIPPRDLFATLPIDMMLTLFR